MSKKIIVVTALIGAYDSKLLDFEYDRNKYEFVCYTNMKRLKSDTWDMRYVDTLVVPDDNAKSSYYYKWNPHKYLDTTKYDTMIWMDSSFTSINTNVLDDFIKAFEHHGASLFIEKHPGRNTLQDELNANVYLNKDDIGAMKTQVANYFKEGYSDSDTVMVETGLSFRKFNDPALIKFSEAIWNEIAPEGNTKRDQLVYDYCMWKTSFKDYALFTFADKCKLLTFSDHPNRSTHKEKVLMVGPWLGEEQYEHKWVLRVQKYLSENAIDKVFVGCRPDREYLYERISPNKFIISNPDGVQSKYMFNGCVPRFNITSQGTYDIVTLLPNYEFNSKLEITDLPAKTNGEVNVYYNMYVNSNVYRQSEMEFCFDILLNNLEISKIIILHDNTMTIRVDNPKLTYVAIDDRPTYNDYFKIMRDFSGCDDINIMLNSDCFLVEHDIRKIKKSLCDNEVWCLSRKEIINSDTLQWKLSIKNYGSQDCWIFKGKPKDIIDAPFPLGVPGCDNKIAYELFDAGYYVINPSDDVILYHNHISNIREYNPSDMLPKPYLMVQSCMSTHKYEHVAILDDVQLNHRFDE
jgi:hypothetical protein